MHYEFQLNLYSNPTSALKSKLQLYLVHKFKLIKQSLEDLTLFIESLLNLIQENSNLDLEFTEFDSSQVKNELLISFYSTCLTEIYTSVNKLDISSNHYIASQLVKLINSTNYYDSFSITYDFCTAKSNEIYFYLMKNFISNHSIKNLLIERFESRNKNSNFLEETCIQKLCNLPDKFLSIIEPKISFKNKKVYSSYFLPNNYYLILTTDLYMCLKTLNEKLLNNLEGIQFLSTVYGKISFNGYSEILFDKLIKNLLILCYNNEIWKAFSRKFFEFMPYKYLEASLLSLIRKLSR
ncbi:unnamed protein product [Brachionus calyciflorus]|uniref:Uncharacterized protein n=1 Tax=Brachionus calyciflorus TaxID=104777 RepID=A0A814CRV4_9BILA|nr:unnamed protein product [Brachionus calyciflorus]